MPLPGFEISTGGEIVGFRLSRNVSDALVQSEGLLKVIDGGSKIIPQANEAQPIVGACEGRCLIEVLRDLVSAQALTDSGDDRKLTVEEIEAIKKRLKTLGYL